MSLYEPGVSAALDLFGQQNVLILLYEDLVASDANWKRDLSAFFGVDLMSAEPAANLRNARGAPTEDKLSPENQRRLLQLFMADSRRLSRAMNRDMVGLWGLR